VLRTKAPSKNCSNLSYRPTELFRKAMLEGDVERARMIVEVASGFLHPLSDQAQELTELAKQHLPDESGPGLRETTWPKYTWPSSQRPSEVYAAGKTYPEMSTQRSRAS